MHRTEAAHHPQGHPIHIRGHHTTVHASYGPWDGDCVVVLSDPSQHVSPVWWDQAGTKSTSRLADHSADMSSCPFAMAAALPSAMAWALHAGQLPVFALFPSQPVKVDAWFLATFLGPLDAPSVPVMFSMGLFPHPRRHTPSR